MRYEVKLTSQAIEQIEEIVQYISKVLFAPETARKWADILQSEIAKLDFMPSRYPLTEEEPWHTKEIHKNLNEIKKTRLAYDNITVQLSKKNTRFQYKLIKKGGRASEFENAIEWLCLSGIASRVYRAQQIKKPLENYKDINAFKIYVSDLGLLCAKKDLMANDILYMVDEINDFKGGMVENYVHVQLTVNGYRTYYWESERGAEVDFVIQRDGRLIPIEVKSADNMRAKSLKVYMETYSPDYAIKLSAKNFGFRDKKKTVPLYAAFCI